MSTHSRLVSPSASGQNSTLTGTLAGKALMEGFLRLFLSQVVLPMPLSFAVFPLVHFTSSKRIMGEFANLTWPKIVAWGIAISPLTIRVISRHAAQRDLTRRSRGYCFRKTINRI